MCTIAGWRRPGTLDDANVDGEFSIQPRTDKQVRQ